ncbi:MAG: ATP-dependent Clp protease ATP-binding subunit [Ruminococcaceae bacterium]|nr:ATP-dependent Clp protease ATP-binding subunit [Oscillospiraceae bacterium]
MKLCSKCNKRPAVVFISDANNPQNKPNGLCLLCAKEVGIKPIDDMLKSMNISDENIEELSEHMNEMMGGMSPEELMAMASEEMGDMEEMEDFESGGAPTFPSFLNQIFGNNNDKKDENAENTENDKKKHDKKKKGKKKYLDMYCTNLTQRAREGKIDAIVGRDEELYRTIQILSRRSKNNPCLIGEPGVGKTAIVEGLAMKIATGEAPARLLDQEIWLLDLTGLVAGTQFRGQFESRVKGLVEEIKEAGNIILFIDEVHNIVGAGNSEGAMNAGNILKPALSRGEIHVIGATTLKEYRQYIEKDAALERRFQPVIVEEPSFENTLKILSCVRPYYEGYHNIKITDDILKSCVKLSERYITDRYLPDKAIDLMDEACACEALRNKAIDELYSINKRIAELSMQEEEENAKVENIDYEKIAQIKSELAICKSKANELYVPAAQNLVTDDDLARVIELWTGIPASKVQESDLKRLTNLTEELSQKVKGQSEAVELVSSAVKRSRIKISKNKRPASFIFVGPTGVGKTELAKVLADRLFNTPETLLRFDMSEFMEKHSVSRLIGAPPGYVGYDEAGQLTEKVRRKPYSVILFDEIEKAHPDILNIMLQILDDGRITDAQGRTVNFENTIIIMTSNAGSDRGENLMGFGKSTSSATREKAIKALEEFLRPEFISRVDEIIVFDELDDNALAEIAELNLKELGDTLKEKMINFEFTSDVPKHFANECSGSKRGARDLRNMVRKNIEDAIVNTMIENSDKFLTEVSVCVSKGKLKIDYKF